MKLFTKYHLISENDKIAIKNVSGAFIIKGLSLLISIISLPLYIKYFNNDIVLGLWFTLLSLLTWILTFDFGIGNGLRNKLVEAINKNNSGLVKTYISSSYMFLGIIVLFLIVTFTPLIFIFNWSNILNISIESIDSKILLSTVLINYATVVFQFFLRLITFILYALQKSSINNLLIFATSFMQLVFILIYRGQNIESNLLVLSLVHFFCVIGPLLMATIIIFTGKLKDARPSLKFVDLKVGKSIISLGGNFFWIQIMYLGITGTNAFFITNILNPEYVVEYNIYYKLYTLVATLVTLALTPFWSLITKAKIENDWKWIKKYFNGTIILLILIMLSQLLLVLLNPIIFTIWLGNYYIYTNYTYSILFAVFGSLYSMQAILSTFANGFNRIRIQFVVYTLGMLLKIVLLYGFDSFIKDWSYILGIDIFIFIVYCSIEFLAVSKFIHKKNGEDFALSEKAKI